MIRTFQPCETCRGSDLPTREYPSLNGPKRLCGGCFCHERQITHKEQFAAKRQERVQRISERVGALLFDALCIGIVVGSLLYIGWRWILPW